MTVANARQIRNRRSSGDIAETVYVARASSTWHERLAHGIPCAHTAQACKKMGEAPMPPKFARQRKKPIRKGSASIDRVQLLRKSSSMMAASEQASRADGEDAQSRRLRDCRGDGHAAEGPVRRSATKGICAANVNQSVLNNGSGACVAQRIQIPNKAVGAVTVC